MVAKTGSCAGSSPRGRGKRVQVGAHLVHVRLIPARAGKTVPLRRVYCETEAHPRAGGENTGRVFGRASSKGSSPRGRGKLSQTVGGTVTPGLIPARAGKTRTMPTMIANAVAHPRAGGENSFQSARAIQSKGSSPRGRGKRRTRLPEGRRRGLIPARAGKTRDRRGVVREEPAHPRAGGENANARACSPVQGGSSPRGRGKLQRQGQTHPVVGLIPARAGKTTRSWITVADEGAHPRAGGENPSPAREATSAAWLIPARAGKTAAEGGPT